MANFATFVNVPIRLHAHPVNGLNPPTEVPASGIPAPGLTWIITVQSPGMGAGKSDDSDKMSTVFRAAGVGTASIRWQAPNGKFDESNVTVTVDPNEIVGGSTSADPPGQV